MVPRVGNLTLNLKPENFRSPQVWVCLTWHPPWHLSKSNCSTWKEFWKFWADQSTKHFLHVILCDCVNVILHFLFLTAFFSFSFPLTVSIDKIITDFSLKAFKCNCEVHIEWKKADFHIFFSVQVMCLQISEIHIGAPWKLLSEFSLTFR